MELTHDQLSSLVKGAAFTKLDENGYTVLYRFTDTAKELYDGINKEFARKTTATAGVRVEFTTNSDTLSFRYTTNYASSRRFYYFDVFVDGVMVEHVGHENVESVTAHFEMKLPEGTHEVRIYLPNLTKLAITRFTLDDGATCAPLQKSRKYLAYGDSITQGYDAKYASQSYVNLLADKLDAEVINQGIGGEVFRPELIDLAPAYEPDIITVAYGTNDWSGRTRERTETAANEFYQKLRAKYPTAKIFAITPIWRADNHRITKVGKFEEGVALVRAAAEAQKGVTVIEGERLIPHLREIFSDGYLHPNDYGFKFYANALYNAMLPHLSEKE